MSNYIRINEFSPEQSELWERVLALWALSMNRNKNQIRSTLHPRYIGWDMSSPLPHDREAAVNSVTDNSPELQKYELQPLSVQVYDGRVGVAHYTYTATVIPKGGEALKVTGKWSEVYLKMDGAWQMISVSGKPDELQ
ncbi:nuclear transport factor 2 family protein [Methylotuvimicrobium sp. KM2]|uniref:nuclear transport factor 2 family protein n=1 Tax=Methylotuvimicrobium sp. KM2 TaxID=3133976 RepID=UPI003101B2BB